MSMLSSFVRDHLLHALDREMQSHSPELQSFLLKEINELAIGVIKYIEHKIKGESHHEEGI